MGKVLKLLIVMSILYIIIQFGFKFIEKGHQLEYKIKTDDHEFIVKEIYTQNVKNEMDNYYLEMVIGNSTFDYQTFNNFNMQSKIVKNIYYFNDENYECILPVFVKDMVLSDIICKNGNVYQNYHNIKNKDANLDAFAVSLNKIGYNVSKFDENLTPITSEQTITLYNNLLENHYLALENYKGIYTINKKNNDKIYNSSLFSNDIYTKELSAFVGKYYLVADYTKQYRFNEFILIDTTNNLKDKISYDYDINMDSYIQGVIGNNVYLYDNKTEKQYEIDVKEKIIIEVGNKEVGYKNYVNGEFVKVQNNLNHFTFTKYSTDNIWNEREYPLVEKTGVTKSGYYYIYEQDGLSYHVYRSNIQNGITKTYLFTLSDSSSYNVARNNNIIYIGNYIYYKDGNRIKRYSDEYGVQTILSDSELGFNKNIHFGVYEK